MNVHPQYVITGMGITGVTVVLSMLFYAMSTPSTPTPPRVPDTPQELAQKRLDTLQAAINKCNEDSYAHLVERNSDSISIDTQERLLKICTTAIMSSTTQDTSTKPQ